MDPREAIITRRALLGRAAAAGAALAAARGGIPLASAAAPQIVPLPSAAQVRADFQRMVDFGPRLTGTEAHNRFLDWLEREFVKAGLDLLPCDEYETERWEAGRYGLELLEGPGVGPARVAAYYPRSQETPAAGITGPLVYGGVAPVPSINLGAGGEGLVGGLARYPGDLARWVTGLTGTLGGTAGSILVVDLPLPVPLTTGFLVALATYLHWPGHTLGDWLGADYKRNWLVPGVLGVPLAPFKALGAKGVVFVLDSSYEALAGGYLPFAAGFEDIPALYVDRAAGAKLRGHAGARPRARLTLTATRKKVPTRAVTAVLPGTSKETIILDSHTDGEGFVEENGPVALVQLARHFASLPKGRRLKRTLVFSSWPGHMVPDLPQLEGWIDSHPDIVERAAAALTIEHLGCSEWADTPGKGYHPTGEAEAFAIWTTQGKMFELTRDTVVKHDVPRAALLRPPVQFGVGAAFQSAGVPQIGAIAGPTYLLTITPSGDMEKLDAGLAARQIAWLADLTTRLDGVPAAELRKGDPTLGLPSPLGLLGGGEVTKSKQVDCTPRSSTRVRLQVALNRARKRTLRRSRRLRGRVRLNRAGRVRMRAVLQRVGSRRRVTLGEGAVRLKRPGRKRFALRLTKRGRAALKRRGRMRVTLTAKYKPPGAKTIVRRAKLLIRR
jgi:hypothetical protein